MHSAKSVALYDFNFPGKNQYFTEQTCLVSRLFTKVWSAAKKKQKKQWNSGYGWLEMWWMVLFETLLCTIDWRYGKCSWSDVFVAEVNSVILLQGNTLQTFNIKMILTISNTIWIFVFATLGCLQVVEGHECRQNPIGKSCCVLFVVSRFFEFAPLFSVTRFLLSFSFRTFFCLWCPEQFSFCIECLMFIIK